MSFGTEKRGDNSAISKRFVSETELEEIKKKREEEWEVARSQGRTVEREEDVVHDGRTLYERLQEQKDKKQEEFLEQLKFKNMIYKGLDKEDAGFLSHVSQQQAVFHGRRFDEDDSEIKKFRMAVESAHTETSDKPSNATPQSSSVKAAKAKNSKPKATAVIIRKRPANMSKEDDIQKKQLKIEKSEKEAPIKASSSRDSNVVTEPSSLKGLVGYLDSDSDEGSTED